MGGRVEKIVPPDVPTFGFIRGDDGRQYFFMPSALERLSTCTFAELTTQTRVEFTPQHHEKGMRAVNVHVMNGHKEHHGPR